MADTTSTSSTDLAATSPVAAAAPAKQKLDDLMLAMDVVDTLRHQETVATRELDDDVRKAELVERLKKIYASQGIVVSDRIIADGVKALEESRFSYEPAPASLSRSLAMIWVTRRTWGLAGLAGLVAVGIGIGSYSYFVIGGAKRSAEQARVELSETLPKALTKVVQTARDEAKSADAIATVGSLAKTAQAAVARGDAPAAKAAIAELDGVVGKLRETWRVQIVTRNGERSGLWRQPPSRTSRNYYLVVEAIGANGAVLEREVTSEETGVKKTVKVWGQRVPQTTYDRVAADKRDDGIIENRLVGEKKRGDLAVTWSMPVETGTITEW